MQVQHPGHEEPRQYLRTSPKRGIAERSATSWAQKSTLYDPEAPLEDDRPILERDIQAFLESHVGALGENLTLISREHPVPFGRVDLLARDGKSRLVAIELKLGVATRDAVGQLQSYMGALQDAEPNTFVRGILVAASLDAAGEAALRVARDIKFFSYALSFIFSRQIEAEDTYENWLTRREAKKEKPQREGLWLPPSFDR